MRWARLLAGTSNGSSVGTCQEQRRRSGRGFKRPNHDVDAAREVDDRRLGAHQRRGQHGVDFDVAKARLQRPRSVLNVAAQRQPVIVDGVEAITLSQEVLEGSGLTANSGTDGAIARGKGSR